jgi:tetratricopeptide (TPR) repeat protein
MNKFFYIFLLVILVPATHLSHLLLNDLYSNKDIKIDEKFNLPSPEITKVASIGYDNFVADILWLQLIQYFGRTTDVDIILPELYSLINNIITLDPKFIDAYIFGAYALVDNKEFNKAVDILEKGSENNPDEWYLPYQLGFMYYIYLKNKATAAHYLDKASERKGAPVFLKKLAATLYTDAGSDIDIKTQLWQSVYDKAKQTGDQVNLEKAYKKLAELKVEKDLDTLKNAIRKYQENEKAAKGPDTTVYPDSMPESKRQPEEKNPEVKASPLPPLTELHNLVDAGLIDKVPVDPFNRPYFFNENTGNVEALPLPWQQQKIK